MTKQQYIDRFFGKTIEECADFCHEHDVHVRKERIEPLQKENAELRECLKEAVDLECTSRGCLSFRDKICHGTYDCGVVKKWRTALEGVNHANA